MIFRLQVFQFQRLPFRDRDTGEMKRGEGGGHIIVTIGILIACSRLIYIQFPFRGLLPVCVIIPCLSILTCACTLPSQILRYDLDKQGNVSLARTFHEILTTIFTEGDIEGVSLAFIELLIGIIIKSHGE